ncbi:hypothetical protein [Tepidibacillus marianensis]
MTITKFAYLENGKGNHQMLQFVGKAKDLKAVLALLLSQEQKKTA